ncbi:flavodoxin I [Bacillus sp. SORGH_AS 510]|uniref:flavodoxin domain-containing protein n=1 Tax=Bacillus sp. SORGH_AS_0510 TaxID=3041771 RepID=UPI002781A0AC|nr:flavodoxin domain-containing protein [Bacillus sp. SORGH_AS_0510]MDQ1145783.1 flavodoxin I [Bacillus sp. SORGH_AS_0510]
MKIAIVYTSNTGNTEELVNLIQQLFIQKKVDVSLFRISQFSIHNLNDYDAVIVGTYTWGDGNIPQEMMAIYHGFESLDLKNLITAVVGTGDSGYPKFCGAVDDFKDMLYVQTKLVATLKIEITPQQKDLNRCIQLVNIVLERCIQGSNC